MVSLESGLQDVIEPATFVETFEGGKIMLRERQAPMSVEVTSGSTRVTALNMSKIGHLSAICERRGLKRICDYFLVASIDGTCHAVLVELKKTLGSSGNFREQLRRSLPVVKYLVSVVEIEYEQDFTELEVSYVSIFEKLSRRIDKQHLRVPKKSLVESEDWKSIKIRKFLGSRLYFMDRAMQFAPHTPICCDR